MQTANDDWTGNFNHGLTRIDTDQREAETTNRHEWTRIGKDRRTRGRRALNRSPEGLRGPWTQMDTDGNRKRDFLQKQTKGTEVEKMRIKADRRRVVKTVGNGWESAWTIASPSLERPVLRSGGDPARPSSAATAEGGGVNERGCQGTRPGHRQAIRQRRLLGPA